MTPQQKDVEKSSGNAFAWFVLIFIFLWVLAGLAAFFMSVVCFAFSGTVLEKVGGLALAVLFGPFYWIYYAFMKTYCATNGSASPRGGKQSVQRRK